MQDNRKITEAMILAGGMGTRLRSVVHDRPKPMAMAGGRPFMEWLLLFLHDRGVKRIVLCTGHLGEMVEAYFGDGSRWELELEYSPDPFPLGTGGAVRHALHLIRQERFLVLNGDSFCRFDLETLADVHLEKWALTTLWLLKMDDCRRYGTVVLGEDDRVESFLEKSPEMGVGLINAGVYLMEGKAARTIPEGCPVSLEREIFPDLIGRGLHGVSGSGPFLDIGTPESYGKAEDFFAGERAW